MHFKFTFKFMCIWEYIAMFLGKTKNKYKNIFLPINSINFLQFMTTSIVIPEKPPH